MKVKSKTIDEFLSNLSEDKQTTLQKLRKTIKAIVPDVEECISYGIPGFRLNGQLLVWFGAGANHCSFYPAGAAIAQFQDELKDYDTSKGTIRFPAGKPLPKALVKKLIQARMAQMEVNKEKTNTLRGVSKPSIRKKPNSSQTDPAVIKYMKELDHPLKKVVEAVRQMILGVSPSIHEGIKWNSPSFRKTEWFATLNLRDGRVWLILHTGAKAKANPNMKIADPSGLLKWLAKDRCLVTFESVKDVAAKRGALEKVVGEWIRSMA